MARPKEIVFSVLLVAAGFFTGFGWERIPEEPYWTLAVLAYAVSFGFFLLFAANFWIRYAVPLLSLLLTAAVLSPGVFVLSGFTLGAVFILFALWESEKEYSASTEFYLRKVVGKSIKLFFTALAIVFVFSYYGSLQEGGDVISLLLPKQIFNGTLEVLEKPLGAILPGFVPGAVAEEALSPEQRAQLAEELGVEIISGETVADVLYKFSLARIGELTRPYSDYVDVLAAASFFFAIKFASFLFYHAALILMSLLVWLLLRFEIFKKVSVPTNKEMLV